MYLKFLYIFRLDILIILKNIFTLKFYLKFKSLASQVVCLNTFTLHFPIENVLQSQSSLKWWIHSLFISRSKTFSRANLLWNDEYIHSSFPDRKRSPEPIFSEMMNTFTLHFPIENVLQSQSSLKWWIHSLFISWSKMFSRANLLWNDEYIYSSFPDRKRSPEPIFSEMMNTFTLHFPIENIFQSTQSSLKWILLWNSWLWIHSLFISRSKTCWLWIHSLFISRSKTFSRVPSLPWNVEYIHSSFPDRKHSPEYPTFRIDLNFFAFKLIVVFELMAVFELFLRPAFDFLDRLEFFCLQTRSHFRTRGRLWTVHSTGLLLSGFDFFSSSIQLTLRSAVFLRHATFQAFDMHFGTVYGMQKGTILVQYYFL